MTTYAVSRSPSVCTILSAVFGGSTKYTLNVDQGSIDSTSDDSARWGQYLTARRGWSVAIEGLYIYNDSAQIYLEQHFTDEEPAIIVVMLTPEDEKVFQGNCNVTSLDYSSNFEDVMTIHINLGERGLLVATES